MKKVARELLDKIKQQFVLDWRKRAAACSKVKVTIEDVLDQGLPPRLFDGAVSRSAPPC